MLASVSAVIAVIALVHVYWGFGGVWPGRDAESLARTVVGGPPGMRMQRPVACFAAAVVFATAAVIVGLGARLGVSHSLELFGRYSVAAGFGLRGVYGYLDRWVRPATRGSPFERLNMWVYSPLCLALSGLIVAGLAL